MKYWGMGEEWVLCWCETWHLGSAEAVERYVEMDDTTHVQRAECDKSKRTCARGFKLNIYLCILNEELHQFGREKARY